MIRSFGNKEALKIWEGKKLKIPAEFDKSGFKIHRRAKAILTVMHATNLLEDLKSKCQPPDMRLHKLKGNLKGRWSVTVKLPWVITFRFENGDFVDVKFENYHKG